MYSNDVEKGIVAVYRICVRDTYAVCSCGWSGSRYPNPLPTPPATSPTRIVSERGMRPITHTSCSPRTFQVAPLQPKDEP